MATSSDLFPLKLSNFSYFTPRLTSSETFSALCRANASLPSKIRLPVEILGLVNKEVHANAEYKEIRSKWIPIVDQVAFNGRNDSLQLLLYDTREKRFFISKDTYEERMESGKHEFQFRVPHTIAPADLLYRLRCFFPEVYLDSHVSVYKPLWEVRIRHRHTGLVLLFDEFMSEASVATMYDGSPPIDGSPELEMYVKDAIYLMDMFFKTVDGEQLLYFHPAVEARSWARNEKITAVPSLCINGAFAAWYTEVVDPADLLCGSLIPRIESRKVDAINGTTKLTDIISSSSLFHRLIRRYDKPNIGIDVTLPVTSVWHVKLVHKELRNAAVIFMDDHGLFDIRAGGEVGEAVMKEIVDLVDALLVL